MTKKITAQYKEEAEKELDYLKNVLMAQISEEIKDARAHGDISENAEYDAAMNRQAETERRIQELERILRDAIIIDENEIDTNVVNEGAKVRLCNLNKNLEMEFRIVSEAEASISKGSISNESPVGKAILGHSIGDIVEVQTPSGPVLYKLLEITK
ncbi:MAG TPA: transcription elongation factor GreA [Clostridiales bacterium]|jgi:transcription elongation factor GreA|nr:transcription elongation factor GreA [Clostridiales bacterium]